ncbi:hypothetical protein Taro_023857, partial [Colocasia esculenta]|nr:hypothetical protein [Colocasia esculenta]
IIAQALDHLIWVAPGLRLLGRISVNRSWSSFRAFFPFSSPSIRRQMRMDGYGDGIKKASSQSVISDGGVHHEFQPGGCGWRLLGGLAAASSYGVKLVAFYRSGTGLGPASRIGRPKMWWLILHAMLWALWAEWNHRIFRRESCAEEAIVDFLCARVKAWAITLSNKAQVRRLHSLLTIKESAASIPRNLEAGRRLEFFTNSLFMQMPAAKPVREMLVFTPYYSETVLYSMDELQKKNEDGISTLFYLQKIFPDEWKNFLERIGKDENSPESELFENENDMLELRFWASYRGQTLARTGTIVLLGERERAHSSYFGMTDPEAVYSANDTTDTQGYELFPEARAQADLKFTYVVTCQIYGRQKEEQKPQAADIALLMQRNEALRVAFIHDVETVKDGKPHVVHYSKLVKADIHGKDKKWMVPQIYLNEERDVHISDELSKTLIQRTILTKHWTQIAPQQQKEKRAMIPHTTTLFSPKSHSLSNKRKKSISRPRFHLEYSIVPLGPRCLECGMEDKPPNYLVTHLVLPPVLEKRWFTPGK